MTWIPSTKRIEISPSDLDQSVVRVLLVSSILVSSYFATGAESLTFALSQEYFILAYSYWIFSVVLYVWTSRFLRDHSTLSALVITTRVLGIFTDIGALSAYTAISDEFGIVLLPIYITSIIGYGYRFGVAYLYLTLIVSAALFTVAQTLNGFIQQNQSLMFAYYIGIIVVPLYSASLLKRHREVLERINEVNEARSRFIANMSHELRTPLHAIISVSDVLREQATCKSSKHIDTEQELRMISDSAQHLLTLVNRVLDVASAEAGKKSCVTASIINIYSAALTAIRICRPAAHEKSLQLDWFIDTSIPVFVMGSEDYVQEILINTIGNAIKYTRVGSVSVRIERNKNNRGSYISIAVTDTGCGISAKLLPTIFEPFTLGDDSASRKFAGTGLGLTLTKQYVEELGGVIYFDEALEVGTKCTIKIPIISAHSLEKFDSPPPIENLIFSLISPRVIGLDELRAFESRGWKCKVYSNLAFLDEMLSAHEIIVIDSAFDHQFQSICEACRRARPQALISSYASAEYSISSAVELNCAFNYPQDEEYRAFEAIAFAAFPDNSDIAGSPKLYEARTLRVLVADDNAINLATAQLALESVGHTVVSVNNGEDALVQLDSGQYDLALIDMHMPLMSGVEVAKIYQFMGHPNRTPIAILTADATDEARIASAESGAIAFLTKPLRANELRRAVSVYGRRTELRSAHEPQIFRIYSEDIEPDYSGPFPVLDELIESGVRADVLFELVHDFCVDAKALIENANEASDREDVTLMMDALHSLRGAAGALDANDLVREIVALESEPPQVLLTVFFHRKNILGNLVMKATEDMLEYLKGFVHRSPI